MIAMKKITLLLFLSAIVSAFGQESGNPTFKRNILGVSTGFGLYSSYMIANTDYMEPLRSKAISYTFRIRPRFGVSLEYMKAKAVEVGGDAHTRHLFLSAKLTTRATRRVQGFFSPGIGLGFYNFYNENGVGEDYTDKLIDIGAAAGLDVHLLKRFILSYSFNFRTNIDVEPFFYNSIGLAFKF